jgi:hypothetical protein
MNPPKPVIIPGVGNEWPAPRLRNVVRKSALLNLVIVLTSGPVLLSAGGPEAVYPTLAIMVGITVLIWATTFTLFSFFSLPWLFRALFSALPKRDPGLTTEEAGLADPWLDAPV